jgi:hypothetical protein
MNTLIIVNIAEPHLQRYRFYTPLQKRALDILQLAIRKSRDKVYVRKFLQFNRVKNSEIHWLEETGYFLSA